MSIKDATHTIIALSKQVEALDAIDYLQSLYLMCHSSHNIKNIITDALCKVAYEKTITEGNVTEIVDNAFKCAISTLESYRAEINKTLLSI